MPESIAEFKERVRDRTDLLNLVRASGKKIGRGSGRLVMCQCPFHADDGPSFAVYQDQQRWHCYGSCQEGGDCFQFVMKRDNVEFMDALKLLAREAGLDMPEFRPEPPQKKSEREEAQVLLNLAAAFYHERMLDEEIGKPFREYLFERGFDQSTIEHWMLGAAGSKDELRTHIYKNKLNADLAIKIGLLGNYDGHVTDRFKNRVMIPFLEPGRVAFFTGRRIDDVKEKKYLHLSADYLPKPPYNWRSKGDDLMIVEGPLDAWAAQRLAGDNVTAMALMGLHEGDFDFSKVLRGRKRVFVGLDADGTVKPEVMDALMVKLPGANMITWPAKDPADWMKAGATAQEFSSLLEESPSWMDKLISDVRESSDSRRSAAVERAVNFAAKLPAVQGDLKAGEIKRAAGKDVTTATIRKLLDQARKGGDPPAPPAKSEAQAEGGEPRGFYRVADGEFWAGHGERASQITVGGVAYYRQMVVVDDGEAKDNELELVVALRDGREFTARIPAKASSEVGEVAAAIKGIVGPKLTISANGRSHLIPAIEWLTASKRLEEKNEIARTGWLEIDDKLIYVTPGGTVGELPADYQVVLPQGLERYAIKDGGDDSFKEGLEGLIHGLLPAFENTLTVPMVAYALLPPMARFVPEGTKFVMHLVGETGSLKTTTARILMSLYGDFANKPPMASWRSTINSIEKLGFWLPDCLGMVDDYKPRIVKLWDFVDLIQRYADGNDRMRMARDTSIRRREAMRWWMLSTGEDVPQGESSALARMISLRFKRRPSGEPYNADLSKARRLAEHFPTVMARWIAWLREDNFLPEKGGFRAAFTLYTQKIAEVLQRDAPSTPNINRISDNVAMLWCAWNAFRLFVKQSAPELVGELIEFHKIVPQVALAQAKHVMEDKPTFVFLNALREGLDGGRFKSAKRDDNNAHQQAV